MASTLARLTAARGGGDVDGALAGRALFRPSLQWQWVDRVEGAWSPGDMAIAIPSPL